MRETKFRLWDKISGRMIYPGDELSQYSFITLTGDIVEHGVFLSEKFSDECYGFTIENDDYEKMQYTGLKDKNGKEICEGDIISYTDFNGHIKQHAVKHELSDKTIKSSGYYLPSGEIFVIGNIYENPQLLETE